MNGPKVHQLAGGIKPRASADQAARSLSARQTAGAESSQQKE